jgi:hypothetical protein
MSQKYAKFVIRTNNMSIFPRPLKKVLDKIIPFSKEDKIPTFNLGTGTADNTTFLRGDGTWATPSPGSGYVPYTGATSDVDLGTHSIFMNNGTTDIEVNPSYFGVELNGGSKYALLEYNMLTIYDSTITSMMTVNASGLIFPDGSIQTTASQPSGFEMNFLLMGA